MSTSKYIPAVIVAAGLAVYLASAIVTDARSDASVESVDTVGPPRPTRPDVTVPTTWAVPDGEEDSSELAKTSLDVVSRSWVWEVIGRPDDAKVIASQGLASNAASITFRVDPAVSFEGWLPYMSLADAPIWDVQPPSPKVPQCTGVSPTGAAVEARLLPVVVDNANVFTAKVDLDTSCVLELGFGQKSPPGADAGRGDFVVSRPADFKTNAPAGAGD